MRELPAWAHRTVISCIEWAPACNLLLLRIYNGVLRVIGGPYRAKTYFGSSMLCDPRDFTQHIILHFGIWEPNTSAVIERTLSLGDVCVDIGANVGYDALLASKLVGSQGAVIAIEASPSIFELLSRNVRENKGTGNIRLVQKAVSDAPGVLNLYSGPPGNRGQTTTIAARDFQFETAVEAAPLDQILTAEERSRLCLIKMDIEGAETPVMGRLLDTLDLYPNLMHLIVEVSFSEELRHLFHRMRAAGFATYLIENSYNREWYIKGRHQLTPLLAVNDLPREQSDILFTRGPAPAIR